MVELLIGIAVGLLIAAAAASFLANNLRESRALLLESRLMQDLRTAADLITRELRRAGYWAAASEGIWQAGAGGVQQNPYTAVSPSAAASDSVSFNFSRDAFENGHVDTNEQFGFRLHNGAIEMLLGTSNWQALTDSATLTVTAFSVTPTVQEVSLDAACPRDCAPGSATCPPRISVRSLALRLSGRSATDPNVVRTVRSNVRLRNDTLAGACAV
ncbi:MAG: hypothetical protein ABI809_00095 [Caldimonas sp.]